MKENIEIIYSRLGYALSRMPNLNDYPYSNEILDWLSEVDSLVEASNDLTSITELRSSIDSLVSGNIITRQNDSDKVYYIIQRVLFKLSLRLPAGKQGAFIPAGNVHDAMIGVGKVLQLAKNDLLIVDPYLDAKFLEDFAAQAPEMVNLRLLADAKGHKQTLRPAVARWISQYQARRPLEARLAPARSLHDRLILVDGKDAYVLGQSFNHLAERAPTSLVRAGSEVANIKIAAHEAMWSNATPL